MAQTYGVSELTQTLAALIGSHPFITESVTLVSTGTVQELSAGTVLGKITASGKYTGFNPDGTDGSETAAAILAGDISVPASGDEKSAAYVHGEFLKTGLVWTHSGITDGEKLAAYASLKTAGIYTK